MYNKKEIVELLAQTDQQPLFEKAMAVRKKYFDGNVYIRGIIEFSNYCIRNCSYCGLRAGNKNLKRYRMSREEILSTVLFVAEKSVKTVVLQSGDDADYTVQEFCNIITAIKQQFPEMAITLSLGERNKEDYAAFKDAGADRYLLKFETRNEKLYHHLNPGRYLQTRLTALDILRKIGFQVGTGNIIGLPFQTLDDLADDLLFIERFRPDMVGSGPFMPHADTLLKDYQSPALKLVLTFLALLRITTKNAHIPVSTAVTTLGGTDGQAAGLRAGCNVIMINATPKNYSGLYTLYNNKASVGLFTACRSIVNAGLSVNFDRADSLKNKCVYPGLLNSII